MVCLRRIYIKTRQNTWAFHRTNFNFLHGILYCALSTLANSKVRKVRSYFTVETTCRLSRQGVFILYLFCKPLQFPPSFTFIFITLSLPRFSTKRSFTIAWIVLTGKNFTPNIHYQVALVASSSYNSSKVWLTIFIKFYLSWFYNFWPHQKKIKQINVMNMFLFFSSLDESRSRVS